MINISTYDELLEKLSTWAKASDDVQAAVIVGSRARTEFPADEYSDADIILVVQNPNDFFESDKWLEQIGPFWLWFDERTFGGSMEKRVLFDNALDVDFVICSEADVRRAVANDELDIIKRGYRVLIDKIGLSDALPQSPEERQTYAPPAESAYLNLVHDFWYHSVWSTKKLLRGELWMAKSCVDVYMKGLLLQMAELHAHAKNGRDYDTWFGGRFFDTWAEPRVKDGIRNTFAQYDKKDIKRALTATMDLFRMLAEETAEMMGFEYPYEADSKAAAWVRKALE